MSNYYRWLRRLQADEYRSRLFGVYLGLLILLAFVLGALSYHFWTETDVGSHHVFHGRIKALKNELQERTGELASRNLELEVAREANNDMKKMFAEQLEQEKQLQRELTFYRSVMVPEKSASGVAINGVELIPGLLKRQQRLELVLMQLEKRKEPVKGYVEVKLIGIRANKRVVLKLDDLTKDELDFNFRYFQMLSGEFILPKGFTLARVEVRVIVPATRWAKGAETHQVFSMPELSQGTKEPRVILEQNDQVTDNP